MICYIFEMNNFLFTVRIVHLQGNLLQMSCSLFISGSKKNPKHTFYRSGDPPPHSPTCYIIIIIIIIVIIYCYYYFVYAITEHWSQASLFFLFLRKVWNRHQTPHFPGLPWSFLTVFRVKEEVVAGSLALIVSTVCNPLGLIYFAFQCWMFEKN